jgi:FAD/FMN-containing dehydrogenase
MSTTTSPAPSGLVTVTASDPEYPRLRSTYTTRHSPGTILLPRDAGEVAQAIRYAAGTELPVSVRSGGHGLSGRSSNDGGIVLDLSRMDGVEVLDPGTGLVRVGTGARWAQVASALSRYDLAISAGDHGGVGVGGLATAGGIGWMVREYGLTIDHIRAATVVLADGSVVRADAGHEPDLFWAVRGAGSYVGVVTDLDIEAMRLPGVAVGQVALEIDPAGTALRRWSEFMAKAPRALTMTGILAMSGDRPVLVLTAVVAGDDPRLAEDLVKPLRNLGRGYVGNFDVARYAQLVPLAHLHPNVGQNPVATTNALLRRLTPDSARALLAVLRHRSQPFIQLRAVGGAVNDVDPAATAYPHRDAQLLVTVAAFPPHGGSQLDEATRPLWPHAVGAYRNFESRPTEQTFARAFPAATGARVKELAARYDPSGVLSRVDRV